MLPCNNFQNESPCQTVFLTWLTKNFNVEDASNVVSYKKIGNIITAKRYWNSDRPYFEIGELVVEGGMNLGGRSKIYKVLGRSGTPKRPHYDLQIINACCCNKIGYHIDKVGDITHNNAGYYYLRLYWKNDIPQTDIDSFHCDNTYRNQDDYPQYIPSVHIPKKKKQKAKNINFIHHLY